MAYYPLLFQLSGCRCLVVGAGRVGARKIATLLEHEPAQVLALDICPPSPEVAAMLAHPALSFEQRPFAESDLEGRSLVFAATSQTEQNLAIAKACAARGILCNVADAPHAGNFIVPASLQRQGVCLAISTGGKSPALSRILKNELAAWLDETLADAPVLELTKKLRDLILTDGKGSDAHMPIFRALSEKDMRQALGDALNAHNPTRVLALVQHLFSPHLLPKLEQILTEFCELHKEPNHDIS